MLLFDLINIELMLIAMREYTYEYLIRKAHHCGKNGVTGANENWHRDLLRKDSKSDESEEDKQEFIFALGQITVIIQAAINTVQKHHPLTHSQIDSLEKAESLLRFPTNVDNIDESILITDQIFTELGLSSS